MDILRRKKLRYCKTLPVQTVQGRLCKLNNYVYHYIQTRNETFLISAAYASGVHASPPLRKSFKVQKHFAPFVYKVLKLHQGFVGAGIDDSVPIVDDLQLGYDDIPLNGS
ncbi:hypothetical protein Leryth_005823 [Lithospermum erythrorhizon]|nr:hypothetical protein Leryth_005823 [Lithospermum erythrorhizon]